jgi:hypothetical protein
MTPSLTRRTAVRRGFRLATLTLLTALVSTASKSQSPSQSGGDCPRFARVPGYGACVNFAGAGCGFCAYRCNDETVVRWNVCSK